MADSYLERVAGEIADLAIADELASGDIRIIDEIASVLGSSSQTLEEAFLTAVRVRKAEARARALLERRAGEGYADIIKSETDTITPEDGDAESEDLPAIADMSKTPETDGETETPAAEVDADQAAKEDALERLKRAGIGMPRRVQR